MIPVLYHSTERRNITVSQAKNRHRFLPGDNTEAAVSDSAFRQCALHHGTGSFRVFPQVIQIHIHTAAVIVADIADHRFTEDIGGGFSATAPDRDIRHSACIHQHPGSAHDAAAVQCRTFRCGGESAAYRKACRAVTLTFKSGGGGDFCFIPAIVQIAVTDSAVITAHPCGDTVIRPLINTVTVIRRMTVLSFTELSAVTDAAAFSPRHRQSDIHSVIASVFMAVTVSR